MIQTVLDSSPRLLHVLFLSAFFFPRMAKITLECAWGKVLKAESQLSKLRFLLL